jgi:hypothetical protein
VTCPPSCPPGNGPAAGPQPYGTVWPAPYWGPAPGPWGAPPPPRRRWTRRTVALVVTGGVVLAGGLVALVVLAGLSIGRTQASAMSAVAAAPTTAPPSEPTGLGTDAELDGLAQDCHDGYFMACDDLFDLSPSGSGYEQYGMTCGGRVKPFDVEYCTDLSGD